MSALKGVLYGIVFLGVVTLGLLGKEYARLVKVNPSVTAGPWVPRHGGSLVICGGGRIPEEVKTRFIDLAGGRSARIVVIPTANGNADKLDDNAALAPWKQLGVAWVRLLHTRSRDRANDPSFWQPLVEATGVWLTGGKQHRLTEAYVGTEVELQLKELLLRGGVIGGSSAGAAAMTRVMIAGGRDEATEGQGFDLLPGSVVDQHFMKRNRIARMLNILTRHPDLLGFGIDERTALVVEGQHLSVIGDSYVLACLPDREGHSPHFQVLKSGDETDLGRLKTTGDSSTVSSAIDLDAALASTHQN